MFSFYRHLSITTKLFLSNLAFALPMAALIFFMNISFTYDINIGEKELMGTQVLRPLISLLDKIPQYVVADDNKKAVEYENILNLFSLLRQRIKGDAQQSKDSRIPLNFQEVQRQWLFLQQEHAGIAEQLTLMDS